MTSRNEVNQTMLKGFKATQADHTQQPRQEVDLQTLQGNPSFVLHDQTKSNMIGMVDVTHSIKPDYLQSYFGKICDDCTLIVA